MSYCLSLLAQRLRLTLSWLSVGLLPGAHKTTLRSFISAIVRNTQAASASNATRVCRKDLPFNNGGLTAT